jgi:hypothetical protein
MLLKSVNHFLKFTNHFWLNGNHFPVGHYFRLYQTPKNVEIIFQKPFYVETNKALDNMDSIFCVVSSCVFSLASACFFLLVLNKSSFIYVCKILICINNTFM